MPLLYTEAEMEQARETQRTQFNVGVEYGARATGNDLNAKALAWFKSEVVSGYIDKNVAVDIYNGLAEALGWATVTSIGSNYTVKVSIMGTDVFEITGVEADDEDEACDKVMDDLDFDDIELNFTISSNGDSAYGTVGDDSYNVDLAGILREQAEASAYEE